MHFCNFSAFLVAFFGLTVENYSPKLIMDLTNPNSVFAAVGLLSLYNAEVMFLVM